MKYYTAMNRGRNCNRLQTLTSLVNEMYMIQLNHNYFQRHEFIFNKDIRFVTRTGPGPHLQYLLGHETFILIETKFMFLNIIFDCFILLRIV